MVYVPFSFIFWEVYFLEICKVVEIPSSLNISWENSSLPLDWHVNGHVMF